MLKKILKNYLKGPKKIIFTDYERSYLRSEFLDKVNYYKKILKEEWKTSNKNKGIAIMLSRRIDYFAIIFACWLNGGYYVPLSQNISKKNFNLQIKESCVSLLAIERSDKVYFNKVNLKNTKKFKNLSYIIFTSGSTGNKKGVKISVKNFENYINSIKKKFSDKFKPKSLLINGEISFDIVNADIVFALLFDSEICITKESQNIFSFFDILEKRKVESIYSVPSAWKTILYFANAEKKKYPFLKYLNSGGEILNLKLYRQMKKFSPNSIIHNFYGPTEFTINATCCKIDNRGIINKSIIDEDKNFSIGKLLPGISCKINSNDKSKVGELLLSGNQLMRGYLDNNQKNFCIINNKKYYMTGDIVERKKNGYLFFLGRNKDYIKYKGYRINLQEISNTIAKICGKSTVTTIQNKKIYTFIENLKIPLEIIKKKLTFHLEKWEIPNKFVLLEKFPKLENGKINQKKLISKLS